MDYDFVSRMGKQRPRVNQEFEFNDSVRIGRGSYGQVFKAQKKGWNKSDKDLQFFALKEVELTSYSPSTCREIAVSLTFVFFSTA